MLNPLFSQNERAIISRIDSLNTTAIELYDRDEITQSIYCFRRAIKLSDSIDDNYGKAIANATLGNIFYKMDENDDAKRSYLKALEAAENINENYLIASSYLNIGNIYSDGFKLNNEAMMFYQKALKTAKRVDVMIEEYRREKVELLSKICLRISAIHLDYKNPDEAFTFILRAKKHQESIQNKESYYPSPAVFVYTLPNICIGEISIKYKLYSENSFFIFDNFNAAHLFSYTNSLLSSNKATQVLCGWVEFDDENNYEAFLYLVGDEGPINHSKKDIITLYNT